MRAYLTNGQGPSITIMPSKFTLHNHHKLCPLILLCFSNWHLVWNLDWKLSSRCKCWNQIAVSSEIGARRGWKVFSVWLWELSTQNWATFGPGNWQWLNFWGNNETMKTSHKAIFHLPYSQHTWGNMITFIITVFIIMECAGLRHHPRIPINGHPCLLFILVHSAQCTVYSALQCSSVGLVSIQCMEYSKMFPWYNGIPLITINYLNINSENINVHFYSQIVH